MKKPIADTRKIVFFVIYNLMKIAIASIAVCLCVYAYYHGVYFRWLGAAVALLLVAAALNGLAWIALGRWKRASGN